MRFALPNGSKILPTPEMDSTVTAENPLSESLARMTADVKAYDQVRKVDFYISGAKVATDGNYPFEYRFAAAQVDSSEMAYACVEDIDRNRFCSEPAPIGKAKPSLSVMSVTPAHGSRTIRSAKLPLTAQFSVALDTATVVAKNVAVVKLSKTSAPPTTIAVASLSYQAATKTVTIQPMSALASGDYKVTLSSAIRSSTGATMAADYVYNFTVTGVVDTWVNLESGNWNTAANWSTGLVPANGDSVVIRVPGVTVSLTTGTPEIENLTVGTTSALAIAGGNLAVGGSASVPGTLNISSGGWGGPAGATVGTLNLSGGGLANGGPVTVTKMSWTGGGIGGVVNIPTGATLSMAMPFNTSFYMSGGTLNNSGTVTQSFAGTPGSYIGVQMNTSSVINNLAGGVWNVVSDVWIYPTDSTANAFNNAGTFNKTGGTNTSLWNVSFKSTGIANLSAGSFNVNGFFPSTSQLSGTTNIASPAVLNYSQQGTLSGGTAAGTGTFNISTSSAGGSTQCHRNLQNYGSDKRQWRDPRCQSERNVERNSA